MRKIMIVLLVAIILIAGLAGYIFFSLKARSEQDAKASLYQLELNREVPSLTIDGRIERGEWNPFWWSDARRKEKEITVYLTNDEQYLYIALDTSGNITGAGDFQDWALFYFMPGNSLKIEPGNFKTIKVFTNGKVLWQSWDKMEKLPVKYAWKVEEYAADLSARIGKNEAVRVYDEDEILGAGEEKAVYALFAENITDIPEGLVAESYFQNHWTYEMKVPLNQLGFQPGQIVRVFGQVHNAAGPTKDVYFPNTRTKSLASPFWRKGSYFFPY